MEYAYYFILGLIIVLILSSLILIGYNYYVTEIRVRKIKLDDSQRDILEEEIERYDEAKEMGYPLDELKFVEKLSHKLGLSHHETIYAVQKIREEQKNEK